MAGSKITVRGLKQATQAFKDIGDRASVENIRAILADGIDLVRQEAARNVQANFKQDSGALLNSLITREGKKTNAWTKAGGKTAPEARWLEYGHRIVGHRPNKTDTGNKTQPRPFFRPALDAMRVSVRKRISENLKALIENSPYTLSVTAGDVGQKPRKPKP